MSATKIPASGAGIASDEPDLVQRLRLMLAVMHMDPRNRAVITKAADELERLIADVGPLLASLAEADAEIERLRAALAAQVAAPVKRWPFVETPGEFTDRLAAAIYEFGDLLPAVRCVLIEQPPTFAAAPQPAPSAQPRAVPAQVVEAMTDKIAEMLRGTYHCTRVWQAWNVGTMTEDDFEPVEESDTPREVAEAIATLIAQPPATTEGA